MIYSYLNSIKSFSDLMVKQNGVEMTSEGYIIFLLGYILSGLALFSVFYVFRSIGLYSMAKKKGMEKPWLAFVPFAALYVVQQLAPESKYIKTIKNLYVFATNLKV